MFAIRVSFRWWLKPYLWGVAWMAGCTGSEPDMQKVGHWIERGLKVRVVEIRASLLA